VNGINNTPDEARESALRISNFANNGQVLGVCNPTNGVPFDLYDCQRGRSGKLIPAAHLLQQEFLNFHATRPLEEKMLVICHSGGGILTYNALQNSSFDVQQRIIVCAINAAAIIPRDLCFDSTNYMSNRDFVTCLSNNYNQHKDQVKIVQAHPTAGWWDHGFGSPTWDDVLEHDIGEYIVNHGENR